jgi:hypothetical protein
MSELAASRPAGRPLWVKLIMTILLTVVAGPLVGAILVFLAIGAGLAPEAIAMFMQGTSKLSGLFLGYVSGGLQAALCGLGFALYGWRAGNLPIWVPIMTALPLTLLFALALFGVSGGGIVFSVVIHLVPALVTWWLVKAYWQKAEA